MITVRPAAARGRTRLDWLDSRHTFSFGEYHDSRHMGFRTLRVVNEDRVAAAGGFGAHSHRDMEIVSYVIEGELAHRDSLGTGSTIRPGELQRMSAGTGVTHSELNPSRSMPVHFLQIWILPDRRGLEPGYEQKAFDETELRGRLRLVGSREGRDGSVKIHQDVSLFLTRLPRRADVAHELRPGRGAWLQVISGAVVLNDTPLEAGDGAAVEDEPRLRLTAKEDAEALLFDLG